MLSIMMSLLFHVQDALGKSLEEICKVVPGGCLIFFPSYKLMEKLRSRWSQTGQWSRLNAQKPVFVGKVISLIFFISVSKLIHEIHTKRQKQHSFVTAVRYILCVQVTLNSGNN